MLRQMEADEGSVDCLRLAVREQAFRYVSSRTCMYALYMCVCVRVCECVCVCVLKGCVCLFVLFVGDFVNG